MEGGPHIIAGLSHKLLKLVSAHVPSSLLLTHNPHKHVLTQMQTKAAQDNAYTHTQQAACSAAYTHTPHTHAKRPAANTHTACANTTYTARTHMHTVGL